MTTNTYTILGVNASDSSFAKVIQSLSVNTKSIEEQFGYFFWFWFIMFMLFAALTKFTGADIVQPGTVLILVSILMLGLSIMNFFTIDFVYPTGDTNPFINQYGLAMVSLLMMIGYVFGQFNKT